jgi:hypothetical protein
MSHVELIVNVSQSRYVSVNDLCNPSINFGYTAGLRLAAYKDTSAPI